MSKVDDKWAERLIQKAQKHTRAQIKKIVISSDFDLDKYDVMIGIEKMLEDERSRIFADLGFGIIVKDSLDGLVIYAYDSYSDCTITKSFFAELNDSINDICDADGMERFVVSLTESLEMAKQHLQLLKEDM